MKNLKMIKSPDVSVESLSIGDYINLSKTGDPLEETQCIQIQRISIWVNLAICYNYNTECLK